MTWLFSTEAFDTPCRIEIEQSAEHFHAHVELDEATTAELISDCAKAVEGVVYPAYRRLNAALDELATERSDVQGCPVKCTVMPNENVGGNILLTDYQ